MSNYRTPFATNQQPNRDRARGGKIQIDLTIPKRTYRLQGSCNGIFSTAEMYVRILIDVEKLPLVNTAGYKIEEEQIAPDEIKYQRMRLEKTFENGRGE